MKLTDRHDAAIIAIDRNGTANIAYIDPLVRHGLAVFKDGRFTLTEAGQAELRRIRDNNLPSGDSWLG